MGFVEHKGTIQHHVEGEWMLKVIWNQQDSGHRFYEGSILVLRRDGHPS